MLLPSDSRCTACSQLQTNGEEEKGNEDRPYTKRKSTTPPNRFGAHKACVIRVIDFTIDVTFVLRQRAAWASTLVTHEHPPREENRCKTQVKRKTIGLQYTIGLK